MAFLPGEGEIFKIDKWTGINENPDSEADMAPGEAVIMDNFRVSGDGNLRTRPGSKTIWNLMPGPVRGLWSGFVNGNEELLCAANGHVFRLLDGGLTENLGQINDSDVCFFGFGGNVFIINGSQYMVWDGYGEISDVKGYAPIIAVTTPPSGGGVDFESLNLLSESKRQRFSPTGTLQQGTSSTFTLREKNISEVQEVKVNGSVLSSGWTANLIDGTVTFSSPPPGGVPDSVEIKWRKTNSPTGADKILACKFATLFGGKNDTRVFFYGNGSNTLFHSGINEFGLPDPTYFPSTGFMEIDAANTQVTGLCRQYDRLIVYKQDSCYTCSYEIITDELGNALPAFYINPLNGELGNDAPGQVRLIANNPVSLHAGGLWELVSSSVRDERNAKDISRRIFNSLSQMNLRNAVTFDDEINRELWITYGDKSIIYNYGLGCFYTYSGILPRCFTQWKGTTLFGTGDGLIKEISTKYRNDDGYAIKAVWESGAISFGSDFVRKYTAYLWATLKPESDGRVYLSAQTNKRGGYTKRLAACGISSFTHMNFQHMSFLTNRQPQPRRIKMRIKSFNFLKVKVENDGDNPSSIGTLLSLSLLMRKSSGLRG